jgi:hypothetical protein
MIRNEGFLYHNTYKKGGAEIHYMLTKEKFKIKDVKVSEVILVIWKPRES